MAVGSRSRCGSLDPAGCSGKESWLWPPAPGPPYLDPMSSLNRRPRGPRSLLVWTALLLGSATLPGVASGQASLVIESRVGVSIPSGAFSEGPGGGRLAEAPTVGIQFGLLGGRRTYVTVGFAQVRTDCSRDGCRSRWVSTQWDAGVRVELTDGAAVPWIRAGIVTPSVENVPVRLATDGPLQAGTSDRGWGGEFGAGMRFPLSERLSLSPGARWVAVDVGRTGEDDLQMRYWVADVGVVVAF